MSLNLEQTIWYSPWENCFAEPFCVIPGKLTWFCLPSYKHKSQKKKNQKWGYNGTDYENYSLSRHDAA